MGWSKKLVYAKEKKALQEIIQGRLRKTALLHWYKIVRNIYKEVESSQDMPGVV